MTKYCKGCDQTLELAAFPRSSYKRKSDNQYNVRSLCKPCLAKQQTPYFKEYRRLRKAHYNALNWKTKQKKQEWFISYRKTLKCVDCGTDDWRVLQFDHIDPSTKFKGVAQMLTYPMERILAEIAKCEVRCANCHHIKTSKERKFYAGLV